MQKLREILFFLNGIKKNGKKYQECTRPLTLPINMRSILLFIKNTMGYINKKVIWITGASSGIGEALTYELAKKKGVRLIISSRRKEELERVKGNCPPPVQANIRVLPIDLAQEETLKLSTDAAVQLFGQV